MCLGNVFFPPAPKVYEPIASKRPEVREIGLELRNNIKDVVHVVTKKPKVDV